MKAGRALISAKIARDAGSGHAGWQELAAILTSAAEADPTLVPVRDGVLAADGDPSGLRSVAGLLSLRASGNSQLADVLGGWMERHYPPCAQGGTAHANTISGAARIVGPNVQARDVHGGIHVYSPMPQRPPVPRQLPPVPGHFVDRGSDAEALNTVRAAHPSTVPQLIVVNGPAGVGKTTLVSWWLRESSHQFPDGQLYAELRGHGHGDVVRPGDVLEQFLRALGAREVPAELAERVALWRSVTADLHLALMLDDAFTAAQVRPLLPGGSSSLVVVTSRRRLTGLVVDGAVLYQLGVFDPAEAVELLLRGGGGSRIEQDPQVAGRVVALCGHLPLAVSLAAAQLAARPRRPLSAVATALARGQGPLEALQVDGQAAVRTALDESYQLLPPEAARTYRCLGLLPADRYDRYIAAAACATSPDEADRMLDALVETNLLEELGPDSFRFHDLVRLHAQQIGHDEETSAARQMTLRRFVDWCLATATAAEEILSPSHRTMARDYAYPPTVSVSFQDSTAALAWLDSHRSTLAAAVQHSSAAGWDTTCWQLVDAMWPLFLRLRPAELWIEAHTLGLASARRAQDRQGEARMLTSGGNGLRNAGRAGEAADWYAQALRHAEEDKDLRQQAQALNGLGNASLDAGHTEQAKEFFARALGLRESIGYRRGAALSRLGMGQTALARRDYRKAADHLAQAHRELAAEGDTYDAARALALLGLATAHNAAHETAAQQLRQALSDFEESGAEHWQARTWEMLGQAAQHHGDHEEARRCFERSQEIYRPLSPADTRRLQGRLDAL